MCLLALPAAARPTDPLRNLEKQFKLTPESDHRWGDLAFRLGDEYLQRARGFELVAMERSEQELAAKKPAQAKKLRKQADDARAKATASWTSAEKVLLLLASSKHHAKFARMDEALFTLADVQRRLKRDDQARSALKRLIKDYPASKLVPDTFLVFAEYFFEQNQMEQARAFYQKILQYPNATVVSYARYKLGWVHYNLGDQREAMNQWVATVTDAKTQPTLRRTAVKDVARVYAEIAAADKAAEFFRKIAPDLTLDALGWLADHYHDLGKSADETIVRDALLREQGKT